MPNASSYRVLLIRLVLESAIIRVRLPVVMPAGQDGVGYALGIRTALQAVRPEPACVALDGLHFAVTRLIDCKLGYLHPARAHDRVPLLGVS